MLTRDATYTRDKQELLATVDRLTLERDRLARELKKQRGGRGGESTSLGLRHSLTAETRGPVIASSAVPTFGGEDSDDDSDQ